MRLFGRPELTKPINDALVFHFCLKPGAIPISAAQAGFALSRPHVQRLFLPCRLTQVGNSITAFGAFNMVDRMGGPTFP